VIDLQGEKLRGRWHLVRTRPARGKPQWLMFKAKDGREASDYDVVAERPESGVSGGRVTRGPVRKKTLRAAHPEAEVLLASVWPPMLATLSSTEEVSAKTHLLEVKYDGFRALCALSGGKLAFQSRNQLDFRTRFPELARVLPRIQIGEAVIDAEVVALDDAGVSRFQAIADGGASHRLVAFDLLWLEGEDLRTRPLEERRELLESLLAHAPASIQLSERVEGEPDEALETARSRGWEGVIAKVRGSPYRAGRSREWLKLKAVAGQEVVVVGYTPISNGKAEVGALLVGLHEKDGFHYAGKVGTGFTAAARRTLLKQLKALEVKAPSVVNPPKERGARWVKPQLVAQISFAEWTRDGAMRHPSFQGLRDDKKPEDCVREPSTTPAPSEVPKATSRSGVGAKPIDVQVTHPDRVLFPQSGVTKGELFDYYRSVAAMMLPALRDRPLTLQQWPQGIDKEGFFRQNVAHAPEWLKTAAVQHDRRTVHHVLADTEPTLAWLANQSAITLHMMSSRAQSLGEP
ncbi:MAG TPA: non-homologous end-joining DNA ligase, partial [Myxococcaceae bacterium]|nr:non-homologous end-joining DNA ligase [Myxococcaceae bacterium]